MGLFWFSPGDLDLKRSPKTYLNPPWPPESTRGAKHKWLIVEDPGGPWTDRWFSVATQQQVWRLVLRLVLSQGPKAKSQGRLPSGLLPAAGPGLPWMAWLDPGQFFHRPFVADVTGVESGLGFQQHQMHFFLGYGHVLHSARNDQELAGIDAH